MPPTILLLSGRMVMPTFLAACLLGIHSGRAGSPSKGPFVQPQGDVAVQAGDAAAIQRLAVRQGSSAWLVRLYRSTYATPPRRGCTVYLQPGVRGERLRRGEFLRGGCADEPAKKPDWDLGKHRRAYAQVPLPGQRFGPDLALPAPLDGPFEVAGTISDQDLIEIIDLVRTEEKPEKPSPTPVPATPKGPDDDGSEVRELVVHRGNFHPPVDRSLLIESLTARDADHVEVQNTTGKGGGQVISVRREDGHWKIAAVGGWVS